MTEGEAFRWIQRTSMDARRSMRALAQDVLTGRRRPRRRGRRLLRPRQA